MYKTVLEVLTYILQHFRQTFTVCEIDFYNFSCRSERDTSALVGVSLPPPLRSIGFIYMKLDCI